MRYFRKNLLNVSSKQGRSTDMTSMLNLPAPLASCGEPCPLSCKKIYHEHKKDYEPYEAMGPNSGIFDQRAAEEAVKEVEVMGFDAIEFGNVGS